MKNLLVLAVTVALAYLIWDALQPPPAPPPHIVAVAKPSPPKLYFHSALDAPTMSTSEHTGMSYFSTETASRFGPGYSSLNYGSSSTYAGTGATTVAVPAGQSARSSASAQSGMLAARATALQGQALPLTYRREAVRGTPNPAGVAR